MGVPALVPSVFDSINTRWPLQNTQTFFLSSSLEMINVSGDTLSIFVDVDSLLPDSKKFCLFCQDPDAPKKALTWSKRDILVSSVSVQSCPGPGPAEMAGRGRGLDSAGISRDSLPPTVQQPKPVFPVSPAPSHLVQV